MASRIGVLVYKGETLRGKLFQDAEAKAEQNALLDPGIHSPSGRRGGVRGSGAHLAGFKGRPQG
jgi:hypothetical protein